MTRFLCGLFAFFSQTQEGEKYPVCFGDELPTPHTVTVFVIEVLCGSLGEGWFFVLFFPLREANKQGLLTASAVDDEKLDEAVDFEKTVSGDKAVASSGLSGREGGGGHLASTVSLCLSVPITQTRLICACH